MKSKHYQKYLIERYLSKLATREELEVFAVLLQKGELDDLLAEFLSADAEIILNNQVYPIKPARRRTVMMRAVTAACIAGLLIMGAFALFNKQKDGKQKDIQPGRLQATLTLANGQKIILNKDLTGELARQGGAVIKINAQNSLSYAGTENDDEQITYNVLTTAAGEQSPYPLVLSDGTQVLLDAQSSITFPTFFKGGVRKVKVTGKAWLQVVHDEKKPFFVESGDQVIQDLGTAFIVESYPDETGVKTILLDGSVVVWKGKSKIQIDPGQVAFTTKGSSLIQVSATDTSVAKAWVEHKFKYKNEDLHTIMRQLSRWYDIEVVYAPEISSDGFYGTISRSKNISQVLEMLESTQLVHFKIEGRKVTVMK